MSNYNLSIEELQEKSQKVANFGATVKITGLWAWAVFAEKPRVEIRDILKHDGWKWSKNKSAWYLPGKRCCSKESHTYSYIREKYGEMDVQCTALSLQF
jgi:hypothetical protein